MKKIVAIAVVLGLAGGAQAASVGFDFGTTWVKWANQTAVGTAAPVNQGNSFLLAWNMDNDISLGVYSEVSRDLTTGISTFNAIQVAKGVVKNVKVGFNLGSQDINTLAAPAAQAAADIFGEVTILAGTGEKVSGALKAIVGARLSNSTINEDATILGLTVGIWF